MLETFDGALPAPDAASMAVILWTARTRGAPTDAVEMACHAVAGSGSLARSVAADAVESRTMAASGRSPNLCSAERHRLQQVDWPGSLHCHFAMATVPWCRAIRAGSLDEGECTDVPDVPGHTHSYRNHYRRTARLCIVTS